MRIFLDNRLDVNDPSRPADHRSGPGARGNMHFHGRRCLARRNSVNVLSILRRTRASGMNSTFRRIIPQARSGTTRNGMAPRRYRWRVGHWSAYPPWRSTLRWQCSRRYRHDLHDASGKPMTEQIFLFQQIPYACFDSTGKILENADHTRTAPQRSSRKSGRL